MKRSLPPGVEEMGRALFTGLARVANRAIVSGAKSVIQDVDRVGAVIRERADKARRRAEEILNDVSR